ncbi:hypothetical protein ABTX35_41540, partial [Streptomyces sp. NPDC096080]|uniref:hypothetical protein n=1 Tax=Streptomyces sp. NPDC096080 TaxID=3156693 RepID=UPI00331FBB45
MRDQDVRDEDVRDEDVRDKDVRDKDVRAAMANGRLAAAVPTPAGRRAGGERNRPPCTSPPHARGP